MSLTLASGSVTESLHLVQDLLISQLRLTGTCGYLSGRFCYTNNSHAFQATAVRHATSIICTSQTDSCRIRTSIKISIRWKQSLKYSLPVLQPKSVQSSIWEISACPKEVCFSASGIPIHCCILQVLHTSRIKIYLDLLLKSEDTPLISMFTRVNI